MTSSDEAQQIGNLAGIWNRLALLIVERHARTTVGARSTAEAEIDPAREQRLEELIVLSNLQAAVVG
ncbi:hypothetical protein D3C87_1927060 [compost metagenome]